MIDLHHKRGEGHRGFYFLGFTHYLGQSRKAHLLLKRKTSKKRFTAALTKFYDWIKQNRHRSHKELIKLLNVKLRSHYNYYGITFNSRSIGKFYKEVERALFKWINRRGGKRTWPWSRHEQLIYYWGSFIETNNNLSQLSLSETEIRGTVCGKAARTDL